MNWGRVRNAEPDGLFRSIAKSKPKHKLVERANQAKIKCLIRGQIKNLQENAGAIEKPSVLGCHAWKGESPQAEGIPAHLQSGVPCILFSGPAGRGDNAVHSAINHHLAIVVETVPDNDIGHE